MYHVSAQGIDERMINVHYYYYYYCCCCCCRYYYYYYYCYTEVYTDCMATDVIAFLKTYLCYVGPLIINLFKDITGENSSEVYLKGRVVCDWCKHFCFIVSKKDTCLLAWTNWSTDELFVDRRRNDGWMDQMGGFVNGRASELSERAETRNSFKLQWRAPWALLLARKFDKLDPD